MKLKRLRIEHFKRFRAPLVIEGFADGLNLFAAPNEAGKSTVTEAIRAAFFERHRSTRVEHLRPWGDSSATPTVDVEFEMGHKRYHLTKAFLGKKRCDLSIEGQLPLDGVVAEDYLAQLLGFKFPGKGASAPEHMGIPGLLWIRQGTAHELAQAVTYAADHLRQVLGESLGELTSSGGDAVLQAVEVERNELLTPATGNPRGELATVLQRKLELAEALNVLGRDITAYQASVDRLAALRSDHLRDEQDRPWASLREQLRFAQARLEAAQGLQARQETEQTALQQWRVQTASLRSELEAFARDEAAVATRQKALELRTAAEAAALGEMQSWERRHNEAMATDSQSRRLLERVRAVGIRAETSRAARELESTLAALTEVLSRAQEERTRLARLQAEAAVMAVDPGDLKKLLQLSVTLRDVSVRLDAAATTLEFELLEGQSLRVGDEPIQGNARRTVVGRTELHIEGVGRIAVQPGGDAIPALMAQRDSLAAELAALLQKMGVAHPAEAEERARQAAQRLQDAKESQKVLGALAPKGVEALEAELASRTVRTQELRETLAALPQAASGDDDLPNHAAAQAEAERAVAALETAATQLNQTRVSVGKAQSDLATAHQELAAAEATASDLQRAQRVTAARQSLNDALAREAAAQHRLEATAAELQSVNLALLRQDVDRFARSAQQLEEGHERRRQDIMRLEVDLEAKGALGLEEQRAELQREQDAITRRADELTRRAAALDHLLSLLREKRSALARRLRAPLQKHLDHYLGILFPGARMEVSDDLSPGATTRIGPHGPENGEFEELSVGTREQMGIVARLAYADLLQEAGRPTLVILDDALVNTDEERLGQMKRVLYDAAERHQVLIFTCHPAAWRDLGVAARGIGI
ncbi:AAA family ATPase [Ottowia thiooxydans]|uniref:AAA family ATPase n=1 Tax=Ottowia thiooxydans TaxID=219182 RepID=UPI00042508C7|nr:AAA family ATPase [Ottowia thiooxydans]